MPITCRNILPRWQGAITLPQGGAAVYLKGSGRLQRQRSISKATVYLKDNGLSQRQRFASKAAVCFKGNGERHFKRLLRQIAAEGHHLNICATTKLLIRRSRVLAHRERQEYLNSPFRSHHAPWSHPCGVYKDWLPNKRSGSKPVLQWQSVLPHTCLPTVCLFVAEGTSVQSSGVPASAHRRRFRKVPIHGSYEGKMAPIFYPNLWFLRGQNGSNLLPRKGIVGVGFSCRTFSARLLRMFHVKPRPEPLA